MSEVTDIQGIIADTALKPTMFATDDGRKFMAIPTGGGGFKLEQISIPNAAEVILPKVVTQHVKVQTTGSLIDYTNRFKNGDSVLFADISANSITSIIDYHGEPTASKDARIPADAPRQATALSPDPSPRLAIHRATLALPFSLEWQTWTKASGMMMSHVQFATFLEENSYDVVSPVGADLLELCRDLQVIQNVNFGSSVRMGDTTSIEYKKDADATSKGSIALPQTIMLSITVYFGEPPVSIQAYMRRQIEDGKLRLGVQLSRAQNVRQMEFHRIVDEVKASVDSLTTVYGTPA